MSLGEQTSNQTDRSHHTESDLEPVQGETSKSEQLFSKLAQGFKPSSRSNRHQFSQPKRWIPGSVRIIAVSTVVLSLTVGIIAYRSAKSLILDAESRQNLAISKSVVNQSLAVLKSNPDRVDEPEKIIAETWKRMEMGDSGRYLCIIGSDGNLVMHSKDAALIGKNVNHIPVNDVGEPNELTVSDLIQQKQSHSCLNKNARGIWQIAAYVYFKPTDSLVVSHVPIASLDPSITAAALPWGISLAFISGCFFPLALALLYHGYRKENQQSDAAFTALAEREEHLQEQFAELDQVYRTSPVGLCFLDTKLRIVRINEALAALNRIPIEKYIGKTLASVLPELADQLPNINQQVIKNGKSAINLKFRRQDRTGPTTTRNYLINYHPVFNDHKKVIGVSTVLQDVTERKIREHELEELTRRLETIREEERKRISREIHDELGQTLTALKMNLHNLEEDIVKTAQSEEGSNMEDRIVQSIEMVDTGIEKVRAVALRVRPSVLDQLGLQAALRQECERFTAQHGVSCRFESEDRLPTLSDSNQTGMFRLAQEFLTNISRHARATTATVRLQVKDECLSLEVEDNGCGFDPEAQNPKSSLGLLGTRERVQAMQGSLNLSSKLDEGTLITVTLPLSKCQVQSH